MNLHDGASASWSGIYNEANGDSLVAPTHMQYLKGSYIFFMVLSMMQTLFMQHQVEDEDW